MAPPNSSSNNASNNNLNEKATTSQLNLATILNDPLLHTSFETFLSSNLAEENIKFLAALKKLSEIEGKSQSAFQLAFQKLIDEFISQGAPFEINITMQTRQDILSQAPAAPALKDVVVFDAAKKEIEGLLQARLRDFAEWHEGGMKSEFLLWANVNEELKTDFIGSACVGITLYFDRTWEHTKDGQFRVVIVGGGFCGLNVASLLQDMEVFSVILIDAKEYFEYTPSTITATCNPDVYSSIRYPYKDLLKKAQIISGYVDNVTDTYVGIGNNVIPFDFLVWATGSRNPCSLTNEGFVSDIYREKRIRKDFEDLKAAKDVLVIGGGPAGVELASEIKATFTDKNVTLIDQHPTLLNRLTPEMQMLARKSLERIGVDLILGEHVVDCDIESKRYVTVTNTSGTMRNGHTREIRCDKVFLATGPKPNTEVLQR
ncbi:hypothetical protein HK102_012584 [Quaeritorhiza haematococci]|nr:hypothetical protein HK102_012584 [Quaeritorhiza haematococci]